MQQGRHQRLRVEFPFGALGGHRNRVRDIGLTAVADLAQMRLIGKAIGRPHLFQIGRRQVIELGGQAGEAGGCGIGRRRAGLGRRTPIRSRRRGRFGW